jgi:multiple sugar transport system substrate-binding protein
MVKKGKKLFCLGTALFLASSIFTGCGNSNSSSNGKITLTWMAVTQPQEKLIYDKILTKFEKKYPNITVKFITSDANSYTQKITAAVASNTMPDVFYINSGDVRAWVDNNKLLDISKYVSGSEDTVNLKDMWAQSLLNYRYDGKTIGKGDLYAIPRSTGPFAFAYNKTMFEKAGIPLPDPKKPYTWQEFIKVCQELTKDTNGDGKLDQFGTGLNPSCSLQSFVWTNGADWLDKTKTKVTIDNPNFAEALQFFADMQNKYKITPSISDSASLDGYQRWLKGQMAFYPCAPWDLPTFKSLPFDYALIPPPVSPKTGKPATWVQSVGFGISPSSKHPKEATELAMYLAADKDGQQAESDLDLQIPNLMSIAEKSFVNNGKPENRQEFLNIITTYGRKMPSEYTYTSAWYDEFFTDLQPVLDGKITAAAYCKQEQPKMQKLLDDSYKQQKAAKSK